MAIRGRKPTPPALALLHGNPGHRPPNYDAPAVVARAPKPPAHLGKIARKEFRRLGKELSELGVLSELDVAGLTVYCDAWERYITATRNVTALGLVVKAPGSGYPMQNPYLAVANKAAQQLLSIASEYGLTPSSRARVKGTPAGEGDDSGERFLFGDGKRTG